MAVIPAIAVFLLFFVVLHGLYCTKQHKRNANYKNSAGITQHRQHLRRSTFQSPIYIYFFASTRTNLEPKCLLDPRLSRSTRTFAYFKRLGRSRPLEVMSLFGRAVNASHDFFQVRRLRSPIYMVYFSLFQSILRLIDRVINIYRKSNRTFR